MKEIMLHWAEECRTTSMAGVRIQLIRPGSSRDVLSSERMRSECPPAQLAGARSTRPRTSRVPGYEQLCPTTPGGCLPPRKGTSARNVQQSPDSYPGGNRLPHGGDEG